MRYVKVGNGQPFDAVCKEGIFREATTGKNIKIPMLVIPGITKNVVSMKRLIAMGYGLEAEGNKLYHQR
jgi:hypothetical protein